MIQALCVDALNPAGRPTPANVKSYGFNGVRSVFFDQPDWYSYHQAAKRAGLNTILTLAKESFNGRPHAEVISNLPVDADYVVIGNEPDSSDSSSWTMSPASFRSLIRECAPLIGQRCPGAYLVAGGLVSGQVSWLEPIYQELRDLVDFLDIHPYSKTADEAQALLVDYHNLTQIPPMVLEWNRPTDQIKPFVDMLGYMAEAGAYFCWSDGMVDGFGLVDRLGRPKPQLTAMIDALAQHPKPPDGEYVLGFKEWHDAAPDLLGDPIGRERGGVQGFSVQRTSKGRLMACDLRGRGWTLTFWDDATDVRWLWDGERSVTLGG